MTPATTTFVVLGAAVVAEGLDRSGVTAWLGSVIERRAGTDRGRVLLVLMGLSAVLAAVVTPNGAAAALLPVAVAAARRARRPSSQFLMPLALTLGPRLLPHRTPATLPADFSDHLDALVDHYQLDHGFHRVVVPPDSALVGRPPDLATLPPDVVLLGIQDAGSRGPSTPPWPPATCWS